MVCPLCVVSSKALNAKQRLLGRDIESYLSYSHTKIPTLFSILWPAFVCKFERFESFQ